MKTWPRIIIAGGLLLAGCTSVDPVVVAMHGGDPADPTKAEPLYAPPPDVLEEGLLPRPASAPPESMRPHEHGADHPSGPGMDEPPAGDAELAFSCPMHPDVLSREAGTCPVCGMTLQPVDVSELYVCPMHPEVMSRAEGECPKCGMSLHEHGASQ